MLIITTFGEAMDIKAKAAAVSILSNTSLIIIKFTAGMITHSVSIISEAIHSLMDLLAAMIAFFAVRTSSKPADRDHQFGHGKYEEISGFAEGVLIILAAVYIVYESVHKLVTGEINFIDSYAGIVVMSLSVVINIFVSWNLHRVAKITDSVALRADAEHLRTDVLTSAGVLFGLVLIKITGLKILDPIVAIFVAFLILRAGGELCMATIRNLLDSSLPEKEIEKIEVILDKFVPKEILAYKDLRTRKSGADKMVEVIVIMQKNTQLIDVHRVCDMIEEAIKKEIPRIEIIIHAEPFTAERLEGNKGIF